ncbi:hypothetical protein F5148DRAFT_451505 [Russula earlei]|uniref:Uncharacterized protein n=1 Tax=Russula earlei TaxID=71964 RepID=A0ACC0TYP1_9AGAM|nr:hypothetical protein F5148DRAFT_451505 [Russula earlei]
MVPRIIRDLGPFLLETSEDTLSLVLETVSVLSAVAKGSWFTTDLAVALAAALLDIWPKNMKDLIFLSLPWFQLSSQRHQGFTRGNGQARIAEAQGCNWIIRCERALDVLVSS